MKHIHYILLMLLASAVVACDEQYITYEGDQYIMFAEQEQYFLVQQDQDYWCWCGDWFFKNLCCADGIWGN